MLRKKYESSNLSVGTMGYKNREKQREYVRKWIAKRRNDWLQANGPCKLCGSWDDLEVDHVDRTTKVNHRVWSWSESRRLKELAKCQVLCFDCHKKKTLSEMDRAVYVHGTDNCYTHNKCRCAPCTEAHRVYRRQQRKNFRRRLARMAE